MRILDHLEAFATAKASTVFAARLRESWRQGTTKQCPVEATLAAKGTGSSIENAIGECVLYALSSLARNSKGGGDRFYRSLSSSQFRFSVIDNIIESLNSEKVL